MKMRERKTLLGIEVPTERKAAILEKILKDASLHQDWQLVMSLNPEIFVIAQENPEFKRLIQATKVKIVDGIGVVIAAQMHGIPVGERYTGVDMMDEVIKSAWKRRLRVMLIGGNAKLADTLSNCYSQLYPGLEIWGLQGIENISSPTKEEEEKIFSIVATRKPHLIFAAFGSPDQELWLYKNRAQLGNALCAGVGGSFDFLSKTTPRAPQLMRRVGLEWFFRLVTQPWRWKRQTRLLKFVWYVLREYIV